MLVAVSYAEPALPRRKPGDPVVMFPCNVCDRSFRYHSQLQQHQKHHAGIRPYACPVCGQRFALECSRDKHLTIHSGEKPLMCDTCGQCFAHINYLKSHQRSHSRDRPYSCQECKKKFAHATSLRRHVCVMHADTGAHEQFTCHECGLGFPTMSQVRAHVLSHVKESDDRPECGGTCSVRCDSAAELALHVNTFHGVLADTGRQYNCGSCDRVFSEPGNLGRHAVTHTGQQSCPVCGKQFSQPSNLKAHLRTHGDDEAYSCDSCGCSFSDSSTLNKHVLHHCYMSAAVSTAVTPDTLDTMTVGTNLSDPVDSCNVDDIALCSFV